MAKYDINRYLKSKWDARFLIVGNQHKWDSLGPERSEVWKSLGGLPEGPVWWFFESGLDPQQKN